MSQTSTNQTSKQNTTNQLSHAGIYTRARAHSRTPFRTLACAWTVLIALMIGAGNVAWGQHTSTKENDYSASSSAQYSTVPTGTWKIQTECKGAGGGGGKATFGNTGGYAKVIIELNSATAITSGSKLQVYSGTGGSGAGLFSNPVAGNPSYVLYKDPASNSSYNKTIARGNGGGAGIGASDGTGVAYGSGYYYSTNPGSTLATTTTGGGASGGGLYSNGNGGSVKITYTILELYVTLDPNGAT